MNLTPTIVHKTKKTYKLFTPGMTGKQGTL